MVYNRNVFLLDKFLLCKQWQFNISVMISLGINFIKQKKNIWLDFFLNLENFVLKIFVL